MNPPPIHRDNGSTCRAYDLAMRPRVAMLLALLTLAACSGGSSGLAEPSLDGGTTPSSPPPSATRPTAPDTTTGPSTQPTTTDPPTAPVATDAPTTTIDEAAVLAEAEAAYMAGYEIGRDTIRNPDDPENEARIREYYTANNLELSLESLRLTRDGGFIARPNENNPSFAQTYGGIKFIDDTHTSVVLTVCEFDSDRIFQRSSTPDTPETLVRDDPVTQIIVVGLELTDGRWKSATGNTAEIVNDEEERCSTATPNSSQ